MALASYSVNDCMSQVIRSWITTMEDNMPPSMRDSSRWESLVSSAAETGRNFEKERLEIILNWMWDVLSRVQTNDELWEKMLVEKTKEAAWDVYDNASDWILREAAHAVAESLRALPLAEFSVDWIAHIAAWAAEAVCASVHNKEFWTEIDPFSLLERLIER